MKCPQCQADNKDQSKACRKCGMNLQLPPLWRPSWAWHRRTLLIIYVVLAAVFFLVRAFLKPYVRQLPSDIAPWMHGGSSSRAQK